MNGSKLEAYDKLVQKMKNCDLLGECNANGKDLLKKCLDSNEINLWTYWIGGREHLSPRILVLGQDYGGFSIDEKTGKADLYPYHEFSVPGNGTDAVLGEFMLELGYDVNPGHTPSAQYPKDPTELFFTNFVLCYRCGNISGGAKQVWFQNCAQYNKELIEILEPQVILCLGKTVYEALAHVADNSPKIDTGARYAELIERSYPKADGPTFMKFGTAGAYVFPLAHTGNYGLLNRGEHDKERGRELQRKDWQQIAAWLEAHPWHRPDSAVAGKSGGADDRSKDATAGTPKDPNRKDCRLSKEELVKAAKTAVAITKAGCYRKDGRTIVLPRIGDHIPEEVEIVRGAKWLDSYTKSPRTTYALTNLGSFSAARLLLSHPECAAVHNFANARTPGGGLWGGSRAQEESLCRQSTLYASLSANAAKPFYTENDHCTATFYPQGMLFSPNVAVFRDGALHELQTPFVTTVLTAAAPNVRGRAKDADAGQVDADFANRFDLLLRAARERDIHALVLGAWGCGAFGNDPQVVADIFHHKLVSEGMGEYFETIIFAVKAPADAPNVTAFQQAFKDVLGEHIYLNMRKGLPQLDEG